MVKSIIELARALQLATVAEGIETAEQAAALEALGATFGQGYHLARPADAAATTRLLEQQPAVSGATSATPSRSTAPLAQGLRRALVTSADYRDPSHGSEEPATGESQGDTCTRGRWRPPPLRCRGRGRVRRR